LKRIFKADDEIDDDAHTAALEYLLHTKQGAADLRRAFPRGVTSVADLEGFARRVAQIMRMRAANSPPLRDRHQRWPDAKPEVTEKGFPMPNRADQLEIMVKRTGSFAGLCKSVAAGRHRDITERELSLLAKGYAMNRFPELTGDAAFAKAYGDARSSGEARAFWDACEALKQAGFMPTRLDDEDEEDDDEENGEENSDALDEITEKAKALRKRDPSLTSAQAFTKAYEQNPELAKRERRQHGF